jgi:hypothetical protein
MMGALRPFLVNRALPAGWRAVVTFVRLAPRALALDSDNLISCAKHVRDALAVLLGVNDRDPRVEWRVQQEKAKNYGVRIVVKAYR